MRINRCDLRIRRPDPGPEERIVDLTGLDEMLDLLQPREGPAAERLLRQFDLREDIEELVCAALGVPRAGERRQELADLLERHAVAAAVWTASRYGDGTVREDGAHDLCQLADSIVARRVTDVQHLVVDAVARRVERARNRLADVADVDDRAPRGAVALHPDVLRRPGKAAADC